MSKVYTELTDCYILATQEGQRALILIDGGHLDLGVVGHEEARKTPAQQLWTSRIEEAGYEVVGSVRITNLKGDFSLRVGKK